MYYKPPTLKGKPYYVPVVVKNKDMLLGFLKGKYLIKQIVNTINATLGFDSIMDYTLIDEYLDSRRFNDIMKNGKKEKEFTNEELFTHYYNEFKTKFEKDKNRNFSDFKVFEKDVLTIECVCGLGIYSYNNEKDIPDTDFYCHNCGRKIIHYTGHNDYEYDFEGGEYENH